MKFKEYFLGLLLFLAFIIRFFLMVILFGNNQNFLTPDSYDYLKLAEQIAHTFTFSLGTEPELFRMPGYPAAIAIFYLFNKAPVISIVLFQAILDTLTCYLTWKLFQKVFGVQNLSGLWTIMLQVGSLLAIVYSLKILSETIFTFIFILALIILENVSQKGNKKPSLFMIFLGVLFALMSLLRVVGAPLLFLFMVYLWYKGKNFRPVLIFLVPVVLILGGWSLRNYLKADYLGLSTVGSINLYRYNACALRAKQNNLPFIEQQKLFDVELSKVIGQKGQAEFAYKSGISIIKNNPWTYAKIHFKSSLNSLLASVGDFYQLFGFKIGNSSTLSIINSEGIVAGVKHYFYGNYQLLWWAIPFILILLIKYFACLITFTFLLFKQFEIRHVFYLFLILYFVFVGGPASTPRFRVPVEPLLAIYAGFALEYTLAKIRKSKKN